MYPTLPDPIAASAEIARRGYDAVKYDGQNFYPAVPSENGKRTHIYQSVKSQLDVYGVNIHDLDSWVDIYTAYINAGVRYRVPIPDKDGWKAHKSKKSKVYWL
jgi:hypothetical protein